MEQLVIIGRDGVINEVVEGGVLTPEQFQPIPGSLEAIARLNYSGLRVAMASNQPALDNNGPLAIDTLNAIHARLQQLLSRVGGHLDGLFVCPHDGPTSCDCHKPEIGLLQAISSRFSQPLDQAVLIGDDPADIDAATRVGATPMLVLTGHGKETFGTLPDNRPDHADIFVADDLAHAVEHLLRP